MTERTIEVFFLDDYPAKFSHEGRAGGSYTKEIKLEGGFAVITDEWGRQTIFPGTRIERIIVTTK